MAKNAQSLDDVIELLDISIADEEGNPIDTVLYKGNFQIKLRIKLKQEVTKLTFGIGVHTPDLLYLTTIHSEGVLNIEKLTPGEFQIVCQIPQFPFLPGTYSLLLGISEGISSRSLFYGENLLHFQVITNESNRIPITVRGGFVGLNADWSLKNDNY